MSSFKNTKELEKYLKTHTKKAMGQLGSGNVVEYQCPYCKKRAK